MEISIDYALWNKEKTKIVQFRTIKLDENDIIEMLRCKFDNDELPVSIHINKDDVIPDFSIDYIKT